MADKSLSTYAHNVKIVSVNGAVTLKTASILRTLISLYRLNLRIGVGVGVDTNATRSGGVTGASLWHVSSA